MSKTSKKRTKIAVEFGPLKKQCLSSLPHRQASLKINRSKFRQPHVLGTATTLLQSDKWCFEKPHFVENMTWFVVRTDPWNGRRQLVRVELNWFLQVLVVALRLRQFGCKKCAEGIINMSLSVLGSQSVEKVLSLNVWRNSEKSSATANVFRMMGLACCLRVVF